MNAGSFHVILGNQIGMEKKGFVVDRDRSIAVWNQPVYSFQSSIVHRETFARPDISMNQRVQVVTSMTYGKETVPQWESHQSSKLTLQ